MLIRLRLARRAMMARLISTNKNGVPLSSLLDNGTPFYEITTFYFEVAVCTGILKAGILSFSVASFLSTAYPIRP